MAPHPALKFEVHGTGEPLVLVHGLTHRRQAWYPVLEHLTDHREVILFDLPGHGESPDLVVRDGDVEGSLRQSLTDMLDALGLDRPHIAGNSMGGRFALEAAADGLVRSATTLSPAAFWYGRLDFAYVHAIFRWLTASAALLSPAVPALAKSAAARHVMSTMISTHGERVSPEAFIGDIRGMRRAVPAMKEIFPIAHPFDRTIPDDVPVTIAWGQYDLILLSYQARLARQRMPLATHVRLDGCGHVPMADNPELIASVLLEGSSPRALVA